MRAERHEVSACDCGRPHATTPEFGTDVLALGSRKDEFSVDARQVVFKFIDDDAGEWHASQAGAGFRRVHDELSAHGSYGLSDLDVRVEQVHAIAAERKHL